MFANCFALIWAEGASTSFRIREEEGAWKAAGSEGGRLWSNRSFWGDRCRLVSLVQSLSNITEGSRRGGRSPSCQLHHKFSLFCQLRFSTHTSSPTATIRQLQSVAAGTGSSPPPSPRLDFSSVQEFCCWRGMTIWSRRAMIGRDSAGSGWVIARGFSSGGREKQLQLRIKSHFNKHIPVIIVWGCCVRRLWFDVWVVGDSLGSDQKRNKWAFSESFCIMSQQFLKIKPDHVKSTNQIFYNLQEPIFSSVSLAESFMAESWMLDRLIQNLYRAQSAGRINGESERKGRREG